MKITPEQRDAVWALYRTGTESIGDISTELDLPYGTVDSAITTMLRYLKNNPNKRGLEGIPTLEISPKKIITRGVALNDYNYRKFISGDEKIPILAVRENETVGTFNPKTYKG